MAKSKDVGPGARAGAPTHAPKTAHRKPPAQQSVRARVPKANRASKSERFLATAELPAMLTSFGFNLFSPADSATDKAHWLSHAVREFQIYASMPFVAKERSASPDRWLDRLERVANGAIYTGPKDGNPAAPGMDTCLNAWETNLYRCPVVVDAFYEDKGELKHLGPTTTSAILGNYWRYDDPRIVAFLKGDRRNAGKIRVRVCDLTGLFVPPHGTRPQDMAHAGAVSYMRNGWFGGLTLQGTEDSEILPLTLVTQTWSAMPDPAKSTFRVVRVVSEAECKARFDALNAYDDATFSFGPCHWALAPYGKPRPAPDEAAAAGEASGYLAYWAGVESADAGARLLQPFSVKLRPSWPSGSSGAKLPSWPATRNYVGRMDWAPEDTTPGDPGKRTIGELDWLRTTHWFWRLLALSRHVSSFRTRQWHMARLRLRDMLAYEIDPADRPKATPGSNKVPLSRIFTSEASVAILMRCHVRFSGFLHRNSFAGPSVRLALAFAGLHGSPSTWGDSQEGVLLQGLLAAAAFSGLTDKQRKALLAENKPLDVHRKALAEGEIPGPGLFADCRAIADWPRASDFKWNTAKPGKYALERDACARLNRKRNSFKLDAANLPPMPN